MRRSVIFAVAIIVAAGMGVGLHLFWQRWLPEIYFAAPRSGLPEIPGEVTLIAVGDIMLSRTVARKIRAADESAYPFSHISDYLNEADITFGNLECPITTGPDVQSGEMVFHADPGVEGGLASAGFTIVSVANNHTPDFGEQGIRDTLHALEGVGILYAGAGADEVEAHKPALLKKNGLTFAFLAYTEPTLVPPQYEAKASSAGTAFMDLSRMAQDVRRARHRAQFVIVSMHSGVEYRTVPNMDQIAFAHAAIDAGAALVIGHHPHVIQPVERYKGRYIFYSLGNFVFDQVTRETKQGLTVKLTFNRDGVSKVEYLPIWIEDFSRPRPFIGPEADHIFERIGLPIPAAPLPSQK